MKSLRLLSSAFVCFVVALQAQPTPTPTSTALSVNATTGAITAPSTVNATLFASANSLQPLNARLTEIASSLTPTYTPSGAIFAQLTKNANSYAQFSLKNSSTGTAASADFIVENDGGTDTTNYGNFGINSSTFTGASAFSLPSGVYLYSQTGSLALGTVAAQPLNLATGDVNRLTISGAGAIAFPLLTTNGFLQTTGGTGALSVGTTLGVTLGGTGRQTSTTAYGLLAAGTTATGAQQTLAAGATTEVLVGGGAAALPVWTTATGSGAPVRATSPTITTPTISSLNSAALSNLTLGTGTFGTALTFTSGTGAATFASTISTGGTIAGGAFQSTVNGLGVAAFQVTDTNTSGRVWQFGPEVGTGIVTDFNFYDVTGAANVLRMSTASVRIPQTTASTSTTTGALQVAGGLGVAGAGYFGGNGAFGPSFTPNAWGTGGQLDVNGTTGGILGLAYNGTAKGYVLAESGGILVNSHAGGTAKFNTLGSGATTIGNSAGVTVPTTTSAASSTVGAFLVGNGTAATNVAIGGGNINAGGTGAFGGTVTSTLAGTSPLRFYAINGNAGGRAESAYQTDAVRFVSGAAGSTNATTALRNKWYVMDDLTTTPLLTITETGAAAFTGSITSTNATGGLGYSTGAGGTVTQLTSRTTGVTINKVCGQITLFTAAGSATATSFTVTNTTVAATDVVRVSVASATNKYLAFVTATAAGSFEITFYTTGGTASDAPVINFAVLKAVTS